LPFDLWLKISKFKWQTTLEELMKNLQEAVEGCLSVEVEEPRRTDKDKVLEIVV
jgi:predicted RNase H-like HicB family nuclease